METRPSRARSHVAPRPPRVCAGTRRPLLRAALGACLCAALLRLPPAFAVGSGAGCSLRALQSALRCTVARTAALELEAAGEGKASELKAAGVGEEQTAKAPPKVVITDLKVGQTLEGTVVKHLGFGAFVDIGAETEGLVEIEELADGIPMRLKKGTKVTARVLKVEGGRFWLTLRSGDLARQSRDISSGAFNKDINLSPFVGVPADQWFDGEVHTFLLGQGAFVTVEIPGTSKLARGLLRKEELDEGMINNIHVGMKVRVRVLACDVENGRLDFTAKDP